MDNRHAHEGERQMHADGVNVPEYIADNPRFSLDLPKRTDWIFDDLFARWQPVRAGQHPSDLAVTCGRTTQRLRSCGAKNGRACFSLGGIDKVAHMLGEHDGHGMVSVPSEYHLADALRIADAQLGRILEALEAQGLADRTMVVVTADHGGQRHESYLGNGRFQSCCPLENSSAQVDPPYWIDHLNQLGKLQTAYVDSSISLWLADYSAANEQAITRGLEDVSGITEIYAKRRTGERVQVRTGLFEPPAQSPAFQRWASRHSAELVDAMAAPSAPDLVGLLADGFGFGRVGGHGGAQEKVQRIPMIIRVPGETPSTRTTPLRLMDLAPEATRILHLGAGAGNNPNRLEFCFEKVKIIPRLAVA